MDALSRSDIEKLKKGTLVNVEIKPKHGTGCVQRGIVNGHVFGDNSSISIYNEISSTNVHSLFTFYLDDIDEDTNAFNSFNVAYSISLDPDPPSDRGYSYA
jgi:hypothetical protein